MFEKRERLVRSVTIAWGNTKERKLVKDFSSGTIPERILVVITFQESLNSSVWDELNFENNRLYHSKFITSVVDKKGRKKKSHIIRSATYKCQISINKSRKNYKYK